MSWTNNLEDSFMLFQNIMSKMLLNAIQLKRNVEKHDGITDGAE